jgi:nucleoside phosphorylase
MCLARFDAFRKLADKRGADAAAVFAQFLLERERGQPLLPRRIALESGLDQSDVDDLIEIAEANEIRLLERADVIQCPNPCCGAWEIVSSLIEQERVDGEARCSICEEVISDPGGREAECRYQLTPEADVEAKAYQQKVESRPGMIGVILTALPEELAAVRAQLKAQKENVTRRTVKGGGIYYEATVQGVHVKWTLYASFTEAGTGAAAAGAADAILNFNPDVVIYAGIAGGIKEKGMKLCDVVAATEVLDYDGGKDTKDGLIPRTRQLQSAFALKQLAGFTWIEDEWRKRILAVVEGFDVTQPVAHTEPIAAGGKVVASTRSDTYKLVRRTADRAVAVEMEGSGFLGAVQRYGDKGIVIRGISDLIDGKSAADKAGVRKQAVANAVAFVFELLHQFEPEPGSGR